MTPPSPDDPGATHGATPRRDWEGEVMAEMTVQQPAATARWRHKWRHLGRMDVWGDRQLTVEARGRVVWIKFHTGGDFGGRTETLQPIDADQIPELVTMLTAAHAWLAESESSDD